MSISDFFFSFMVIIFILISEEARETIVRPKSLVERARMNVAWLDSSLSIMEQGVNEFDTLLLR